MFEAASYNTFPDILIKSFQKFPQIEKGNNSKK